MRRHQVGPNGTEVNVVEKTIDLAIGSGNHAITYLTRTPRGRLLELPLSWYSRDQAWAMSPGYDRPDHEDFRREISATCLFCHSGTPEPSPISCERCHGPSKQHLESPRAGTILNPARLDASLQLDVCLQCHLQTASSGIQDSLRQPGRSPWSFQPGEPLSNYKMLFNRADDNHARLEINHAGYRLLQSACFRGSAGKLQCTTCHDPHTAAVKPNACSTCHKSAHKDEVKGGTCESCHMPKRAPQDAIHTRITDHKIARRPDVIDAKEEDHKPYSGRVVPFYTPADDLTLAAVNRSEDLNVLQKMVARDRSNVLLMALLGRMQLRQGKVAEAESTLERAASLDSTCSDCLTHQGVAKAMQGRLQEALAILQRVIDGNPDYVLAWINLGITKEQMGDSEGARKAFTEAIRLQPDSVEARRRLANLARK